MFTANASRRRRNLDKEDEAEGISSDALQLSCIRERKVGSVRHLLKSKRFGRFPFKMVSVKQDRAVVRLNPREIVNFDSRKEHCPFGISQSSVQSLFNGGLPHWAFLGPSETRAMKT